MQINRDYYLNKLVSAKNDGLIKVVTGIRRCGNLIYSIIFFMNIY